MSKVSSILPMAKGRSMVLLLAVLVVAAATLLSGAFATTTSAGTGDFNSNYGSYLKNIVAGTGANAATAAVVADAYGNTYVGGSINGTADMDPTAGTSNLVSAGAADGFVAKYDAAGNLQWALKIGSTGADAVKGLAVDATHVYVLVDFTGTIDPGAGAGADMVSAGGTDVAVLKYTLAAGAYVAQAHVVKGDDGNASSTGAAIAVAGTKIYVQLNLDGNNDCQPSGADVACDATNNATLDVFLWKGDNALAHENVIAVAKSDQINVGNGLVVIGSSVYSVATVGTAAVNPGGGNLTSAGSTDILIVKSAVANLAYEGAILKGSTGADAAGGIAAVNSKPTIVGSITGNVDMGGGALTNAGSTDGVVAQYAAANALGHGWSIAVGGTGADAATSITADGTANYIVGGSFTGAVTFNATQGAITSAGSTDGFIARGADATGALGVGIKIGGTGADVTNAVGVVGSAGVIAATTFNGTLIDVDIDGTEANEGGAEVTAVSAGSTDVVLGRWNTAGEVPGGAVCAVNISEAAQGQTTNCSATGTSVSLVLTGGASGNYTHISNIGTAAQGKVSATLGGGLTTLHKAPLAQTVSATTGIASWGRTDTITNAGLRRPSSIQIGVDKNNDGDFTDAGDSVHYVNIAWWGPPVTTLNEVGDNYDYDNADGNEDFTNGATNLAYAANRSTIAVSTISSLGAGTITGVTIEDAANVGRLAGSLTLTLGSGVFALTGTNSYTTIVTASGDSNLLAAANLAVSGLPAGVTPAKVSVTATFTGASGSITLPANFTRVGAASNLALDVISCGTACAAATDLTSVSIIPTLAGAVTGNNTLPVANAKYAVSVKATDSAGNVVSGLIVNISDDDNGDGNDNDGATDTLYGIDGSLGGITITGTSGLGNTNVTTIATTQTLKEITIARAASATNAGTMTIKATLGTLTASKTVTVRGAAANYAVSGPASVAPGAIGVYTVTATDVNGNTPSVQASNAITTPTFIVTNLGTSGKTVSTAATTVSVNPITGGTITVIAPAGGGSGTLAIVSGGKIVSSTEISYGSTTTTVAVSLKTGWNLIRWAGSAQSVSTAVNASVTSVYGWNATTQSWNMWSPAGVGIPGANDLSELATGGIYWVYSVAAGTMQ